MTSIVWFMAVLLPQKLYLSKFDIWYLQKDSQGESLTISIEHEGEDPKIIWSLEQSWTNEQKWYEGRVEVTPIEAAEKPKYRVGLYTSKLEYFL